MKRADLLKLAAAVALVVVVTPLAFVAVNSSVSIPEAQHEEIRERWRRFRSIPREDQQRVRNSFQYLQKRPAEEQAKVRQWALHWKDLSPERRDELVTNLRRWWRMTTEEKAKTRERYANWQLLTKEQQNQIKARIQPRAEAPPEN